MAKRLIQVIRRKVYAVPADDEQALVVAAVASTIQRDKPLSVWAYGGDSVAMWNRMAEWGLAFYDAFNSRLAKAKGEAQDDLNAAYLPALLRYPKLLSENLPMKTPRQVALMALAEAMEEDKKAKCDNGCPDPKDVKTWTGPLGDSESLCAKCRKAEARRIWTARGGV